MMELKFNFRPSLSLLSPLSSLSFAQSVLCDATQPGKEGNSNLFPSPSPLPSSHRQSIDIEEEILPPL